MIVGIILFHIGIKRLTYGIASILVQNVNDTLLIQCDVKHFIQLVEPAILYMNKGKILWFSQSAIDVSLKMSLAIVIYRFLSGFINNGLLFRCQAVVDISVDTEEQTVIVGIPQ